MVVRIRELLSSEDLPEHGERFGMAWLVLKDFQEKAFRILGVSHFQIGLCQQYA